MVKRLYYLNGLAILAVVINHAAGWGQIAMFLWADRYRPVVSPNWDQLGSIAYYLLLITRQLCVFTVPAFLFISGFFVSYTALGDQKIPTWKVLLKKIFYLIIPYTIWSMVVFFIDYLLGNSYTSTEYLSKFLTGGALSLYYFIPLLSILYVISPILVSAIRFNWKLTLFVSVFLQFVSVSLIYFHIFEVKLPGLDKLQWMTPAWAPFYTITYFVIGIIMGLNIKSFKEWLNRSKNTILIILPIMTMLNIIESDLLLQKTLEYWGAYLQNITYHLFGISFILFILSVKNLPYKKTITFLSNKSYGIYLIHMIVMMLFAKFINNFAPKILSYQIIFVLFLFTLGLGIPIVMMKIVNRTFARKYYRYIFG